MRYNQIIQLSHIQHNFTGFERSKLIYHGLSVTRFEWNTNFSYPRVDLSGLPRCGFHFGLQSIPLVLQSIPQVEKWNRLQAKVESTASQSGIAASQSGIDCKPKWNPLHDSANFAES